MTEIAPESESTSAPASTSSRRPLLVGGVALAAVVVLGGSAAFAWDQLAGGGTQPHDVLPSSVVAYARVDGDPSASQKIQLLQLVRKSPELAKEIGIKDADQDLRKTIIKEMLTDCSVDYAKDVEPWIGERFGVGVASSGDTGFVAVQVTDEKAARKGISLVSGCLGFDDPGVAFVKGYALIGEGQDKTEAAAKEAARSPLADKASFKEDMESLGDEGIASVWADAKGLNEAFGASLGGGAAADKALAKTRSSAASLRAGDDNIELSAISHQNKEIGKVSQVDLGELPADAVLAASISGGGRQVDQQWPALTEAMGEFDLDGVLGQIEDETGFVLPADLKTLLGDNLTLVAGDRNLAKIQDFQGPADIGKLDVALALHSDSAKATELANRIASLASRFGGFELAVVKTKDGAVLATNKAFANSFTKGKSLRESESFGSVISDENSSFGGFYLDIAKTVEVARSMDAPAKDLKQVKQLRALGLSVTNDSDRVSRATLKLSFR
ncbi:MAG: DUF3352 domain-containing protein [Actinomycetota bacterium]|nr:DUF3352 domain-containing protein [Actinomycetota bacterium]